jgi:ketosteroid isomerase-like protein
MNESDIERFTALESAFNQAMISNDVRQIANCISDDWVLVTSQKGPISREAILAVVANGVLSHDTMTKRIDRVKVYGDIALVTGRGQNTGHFMGQPIVADEWITDVYHRVGEHWRCVLTHLTPTVV